MHDEHMCSVEPIEDAAWRLDDLPITSTRAKLTWPTAAFRVCLKLLYVTNDAFDKTACSRRAFQCDVVCNCLKIRDCRFRPDYFSHLPRRFSA